MSQRFLYQDEDGDWVFGKGKHEDESLEDVAANDPDYLDWLIDQEWVGDEWMEAIQDVM